MGDPRGFLKVARSKEAERDVSARLADWEEFSHPPAPDELTAQAGRCMDCGIPFCHQGCPLGNVIPEWNDYVFRGQDTQAVASLLATNNLPEITGRVCPAPCEATCVLNLDGQPVSIKMVEKAISANIDYAPVRPRTRSGKSVAIVGSGPAGLTAAQQLARAGHSVTVFERDDRIGGLLRYGIPDFKLGKELIDRRVAQLSAEGVAFRSGVSVGVDLDGASLRRDFDAVVLCLGAREARELPIPGRHLAGVHLAMDFLTQQNRRNAGDVVASPIDAAGKHVVVIGGGDTGSDCVGTANRQGATSVTQLELMPKPDLVRAPSNPWPEWPLVLRTSSSQEEGCVRDWAVLTKAFAGRDRVEHLEAVRVERTAGRFVAVPGGELRLDCDLALLAMGFVGPEPCELLAQLELRRDPRGNVAADARGYTEAKGVFVAGDVGRGQSLVVWAIADGRRVAASVDAFLVSGR